MLWTLLHIIIEWKCIYWFACGLETSPSTTKQNLAHTWIMEKMILKFRSLRFQEGNIKSVWQNRLGVCLGISRFWVLKFTNFFHKSKICGSNLNKAKSDINPSHLRQSGFTENMSWFRLGIVRLVACGNTLVRLGSQEEYRVC